MKMEGGAERFEEDLLETHLTLTGRYHRNDRDFSRLQSIRTNRWYLRVIFWLLDHLVHQSYVTVAYCAASDIGPTD